MTTETYILKRIEAMEEELTQLKKILLEKRKKAPVSLQGIWKGVDFSEKEIEEAKRSLFRDKD